MEKIRLWCPLGLLLLFILSAAVSAENPAKEYIGTETCLECHDQHSKSIVKTPHNHMNRMNGEFQIGDCEACHGPGSIHMDDPELKGSILNFKEASFMETSNACLACHNRSHALQNFRREKHLQTGESCLACHTIHQEIPRPQLLAKNPRKLCFSCHPDKISRFNLPYHHKIIEGRMTCWSCHDPHNTQISPQSLGYKQIIGQCYTCHPSQRGPFTYEHLASNITKCQVCHDPHGSENAKLLRRSSQYFLCLECHSGTDLSQGRLGEKTPDFHITTHSTYQNCTICHVKIHGSYFDSHFLR